MEIQVDMNDNNKICSAVVVVAKIIFQFVTIIDIILYAP